MQKGFKFFLTILFVVALVFSVEGCSDLYKDSETANVSFSLNLPKEFFASRNAEGEENAIEETKSNYIKITLRFANGEEIDTETVSIEEDKNLENRKIKISFDSIPVGSTVYATAEADINGAQYEGKTEPEFIKRGVNTLKLVLYEIPNAPSDEDDDSEPEDPADPVEPEPEEPTEPNYYKVTFNSNGGYFEDGNDTKEFSVEENQTIQEIQPNEREGYSFDFWYVENSNEPFDFKTQIATNLNLYAKWCLDSQYLLFSEYVEATTTDSYFNVVMQDDVKEIGQSEAKNYSDFTIGGPDFFYYLAKKEDGNPILTKSNDSALNKNALIDIGANKAEINQIYYDSDSNKLHGLSYKTVAGTYYCEFAEDLEIKSKIPTKKSYQYSHSTYYKICDFAVDCNNLYITYFTAEVNDQNNVTAKTDIYNLSNYGDSNDVLEDPSTVDLFSFTDTDFISYCNQGNNPHDYEKFEYSINDMIVVDGKLYILWNRLSENTYDVYDSDNPSSYYSYGGVLCYDPEKGQPIELFDNLDSLDNKGISLSDYSGNTSEAIVKVYQPESKKNTTALFGPTKFIAIKPKKLVFADEGIFVYNDENNNAKYKNVNRVVEIDLGENWISQLPTDATFSSDKNDDISVYSGYSPITLELDSVSSEQ